MNNSACASCPFSREDRLCTGEHGTRHPENCPTANGGELMQRAFAEYDKPEIHTFAINAAKQTAAATEPIPGHKKRRPCKPRIQEIAEFCKRMGYKRIGLAFCGAVHSESAKLEKILRAYGLDVVSVMCKAGGMCKSDLGIAPEDYVNPGTYEVVCNPIGQAMMLNDAGTEFNLVFGLCVGHDSLFLKYSEAMCTIVAAKDRLMGHNPVAVLNIGNYAYLYEGDGSAEQ